MTFAIAKDDLVSPVSELSEVVGQQTVFLQKDGKNVAAIVSIDEYESTHEARAQQAIRAMKALSAHMSSVATPEELEELVRELDTKRS